MSEEFGPQQSPTPKVTDAEVVEVKKPETIGFCDALEEVVNGKKIHKLEWQDKEFYGYIKDGLLMLHKPDGKDYQWVLNDGDITGTDWIIID